jgi:hypothetical protein
MPEAFSYKFTTEDKPLSFDFSQMLATGETISTASCSALVIDGTDASPSSLLSGSATISGTKVYQRVHNGTAGVTYRLVMTITTSASNTLVAVGDLPVTDPEDVQ